MSDAVTTTAAAAAPASQAPASAANAGQNPGTPGTNQSAAPETNGAQSETPAEQKERILAEQDLDAFIVQKINGKEERIKVRDALKGYGLDKTANQRMQEAAQARKQAQQLMHLMQTDFPKYCEVTGQDPNQFLRQQLSSRKEIAEEILAKEYERQEMAKTNPDGLRAQELEAELQRFKAQENQRKQPLISEIKKVVPESQLPKGLENASPEQLQQFLQVKQQEFSQGLDNLSQELLGAWEKVGLPKQKEFGQWMALVMADHQKRTGEPLQAEQAAVKVKNRFQSSTRSLLGQMDGNAISEFLGEEIVTKLREHAIEQVRSSGPQFGQENKSPAQPAASEPKKYMNQTEWRIAHGLG
jgi:hypothetical protein